MQVVVDESLDSISCSERPISGTVEMVIFKLRLAGLGLVVPNR